MKGAAIDTLNNAIRTVLSGQLYVSDRMRNHVLQGFAGRPAPAADECPANLTGGELVVLQMTGAGASAREIAEKLGLQPENHRNPPQQHSSQTKSPQQRRPHSLRNPMGAAQ